MAKKIDPQAKAKRQKIFAVGGGVLLLGLLAFQVPRTMKMLHPSTAGSPSSSSASAGPSSSTPPAASPSGVNSSTAVASAGEGLADSDPVPTPQSGQLLAFGRFRTKDPFVQQLGDSGPTGASGVAGSSGAPQPAAEPQGSTGATSTSAQPNGGSNGAPLALRVAPATARISVNGSPTTVRAGGTFPSSAPVFELVSLTKDTAKVGIAGGSLESGAPTVTLKRGSALTLLNTADGTRYVLRLLSIS